MVIETRKLNFTGWKTTLGGVVVAVLLALSSYLQQGHKFDVKDPMLWAAVAVAVKGYFTADAPAKGGSTPPAPSS